MSPPLFIHAKSVQTTTIQTRRSLKVSRTCSHLRTAFCVPLSLEEGEGGVSLVILSQLCFVRDGV